MKKVKNIFTLDSNWMQLYCDIWEDNYTLIEYWRIEKKDSIIVVTTYNDNWILPKPQFRPGVNKKTLDFPGGRQQSDDFLSDAKAIICRELKLTTDHIKYVKELSTKKYIVNSSFSSQSVIYLQASLKDLHENTTDILKYPFDNINALYNDLECLQCLCALNLYLTKNSER